MTNNNNAIDYLDYYFSNDNDPDFAVMLEGPWGSGKTHFVKEYLKARQTEGEKSQSRERGHLYASLYGVRSTLEITAQFFSQAHPVLNSKAARLLGSIASRVLNGFAGTDVNCAQENKEVLRDLVLKLDGRILVFDDLERCSMPLADVLGFINAFVEHEGMKVVVIASENDIPKDQVEEYRKKKEKLIGKTLRVGSDPQIVLAEFLGRLKDPDVIETITRDRKQLLRVFEAFGTPNFRSMRAVLYDYERLVTLVDARLREVPSAMTRLLLYLMAAGLEFRSGSTTRNDLAEMSDMVRLRVERHLNKKNPPPAVLKAERLEATYGDVDWSDPIIPPVFLASLFATGTVDISAINQHLGSHPLIVGYEATPAWRQLWDWTSLDQVQYKTARDQLVDELRNHVLTHPGIILHAAGVVISLSTFGDNLLGPSTKIPGFFKIYFNKLVAAKRLEPMREVFDPLRGSHGFGSLGYNASNSSEFKLIFAMARDATELSFSGQMRETAKHFINRLKENPDACSSLHTYGVQHGNYADAALLHFIDVKEFADLLIPNFKPNDQVFAALTARYDSERHNQKLANEYNWIKKLRKELEKRQKRADPPYTALLNLRVAYYFDKIEKFIAPPHHPAITDAIESSE